MWTNICMWPFSDTRTNRLYAGFYRYQTSENDSSSKFRLDDSSYHRSSSDTFDTITTNHYVRRMRTSICKEDLRPHRIRYNLAAFLVEMSNVSWKKFHQGVQETSSMDC